MAKIPKDPTDIFNELTKDYQDIYGKDLVSIILYGSAASGNYIPKKSDINFLIVLSEAGINRLQQSFKTVEKWHKRNVSTPLFLTKSYISSSLDSFPIEFLNMQKSYQVVFGEDVLKELSFEKRHLRLQCERELKGKLLQLRQAYLESRGKPNSLSLSLKIRLLLLYLFFGHCSSSKIRMYLRNRRTCSLLFPRNWGVAEQTFVELLKVKEGTVKLSSAALNALFEDYIKEIRTLVYTVDQLTL